MSLLTPIGVQHGEAFAQARDAQNAPRSLFGINKDDRKPEPEELPGLPGSEGAVVADELEVMGINIFGLLAPDEGGKDVFVHISAVERSGLTGLADNQKVEFEMSEGRDGRQMATDLKVS